MRIQADTRLTETLQGGVSPSLKCLRRRFGEVRERVDDHPRWGQPRKPEELWNGMPSGSVRSGEIPELQRTLFP